MCKCSNGGPCYKGNDVIVYKTYPSGCSSSSSSGCCTFPISSDNLYYAGPNLPYTGIQTVMDLTESIQRMDAKLNPTELLEAILQALQDNPDLKTALCEELSDCP